MKTFSENMQQFYRRPPYRSVIYVKLHAITFWETVSGKVGSYISCLSNKMHLQMAAFDGRKTKKKQGTTFMQVAADTLSQRRKEYIP